MEYKHGICTEIVGNVVTFSGMIAEDGDTSFKKEFKAPTAADDLWG